MTMSTTTGPAGVSPLRLPESTARRPTAARSSRADGLSLYIASTRTGTLGGNDIWVADRDSKDEPFGTPSNPGAR